MSDCQTCGIEKVCHYPYKPCDCVHQRKYWSKEQREEFDRDEAEKEPIEIPAFLRRGND